MTDNFEKAQQRILKESKTNGGVTTDHILDALIATNEDLDVQHKESLDAIEANKKLLMSHFEEAFVRDERIAKLEAYKEDVDRSCLDRVKRLIEAEHGDRHDKHVAEMHKLDEEAYDIKKLYRMLRWVAIVLGGGVLLILADQLGNLIFGGAT